jgi:heme-degrading monooxygenase HmoA
VYARSTTLHGKTKNIDAGLRFVETEVQPVMDRIEGCLGLSCLVDRETGQCILTSSWETEEAMIASDDQLRAVRERGREIFGGSMQIDEWEIAVMHRSQHGSRCRVAWLQGDMDALVDVFKYNALPSIEEIPGFCSASVLVNRSTNIACVTTTYDSQDALDSSRPTADQIRARSTEQAGTEVLDVREFELPYAHLHVPERV